MSCSLIHLTNDGSSSPSRLAFPSTATNNEESMISEASFDASLEMLVAGLSGTSPSSSPSSSSSMVPPPPPLSRIMVASKRCFPSVSSTHSEDATEPTTNAAEEELTPSTGFHKEVDIQQPSTSSYHKRDSLLAALALGASSTKPSPQDTSISSDTVLPKIDLKQDTVLQQCIQKRKRRVCFAPQATCYPPSRIHAACTSITPQEQEAYWYSRQDLGEMKRAAKRSCHGLNLNIALNKVYNSIIATNHDDNDKTNDSSITAMAAAARGLQQLPQFEMQRGLERWSSRHQMFSRCVTILQAKTEVTLEQVNQQYLHEKRDAEQFRQAIQESSRKSARYARLLGLADAHAAGMPMTTTNHQDDKDDNNDKSTSTR